MMKRMRAFLAGIREANLSITTRIEGPGENAYEYGRRIARCIRGLA